MRILIVEDEPKLSAFVKRGLTAERYAVDTTVRAAQSLLRSSRRTIP
jgi:two-component system copper resistance phosphate regulon response regulator CusR